MQNADFKPPRTQICTLRNEVKISNIDGHDPNPIAGGDDFSVCLSPALGNAIIADLPDASSIDDDAAAIAHRRDDKT